jgi:hypothetical protein
MIKSISKALLVFASICLLYIHSAMAQQPAVARQIVSGTVRDETTGKPIRNVSIFFDGTLNGTVSDSAGNFTLYPKTAAKLPILVSGGVGYNSKTITDYSFDKKLIIDLKVSAHDLDLVTVKANDGMSRKEKIRIFRREFLGVSPNAKKCEIVNESDLRFTYSTKTHILKATCDKPLIIYNKNLGYTLNFLLTSFTYTGEQTAFYGSQFFREDVSPADLEKVKRARKNAYLGSQLHFIRALWNNKLKQNGFEILKNVERPAYDSLVVIASDTRLVFRTVKRFPYDSIVITRGNQKYLNFSSPLKITYKNRASVMENRGKPVVIESSGYVDPSGIVWTGDIGMQRAGDLLPLEYVVDTSPTESKEGSNNSFATYVSLDSLHSRMPLEKLYIQLDKPYYSTGDTLRMKAYLLDAASGKGSDKSGIVYIELANDSSKVLFRRMLPVGYGLGTGNIILRKEDIPEGSYTLKAYTNLMRNFGEDIAFKKNLYISNGSSENWLVNSKTTLSKQSGKDNLQLALQFRQLNKQSLSNRELEIRVMDGEKVLQRDKVQTDIDGKMDVNFNLPENIAARNLSMVVADSKSPDHKTTVPLTVNRPENIDLQFMPEGGNLITGISSRVGFKAIGEDGIGIDVSGKVYNSTNEVVASFASSYKGMGSFDFKPLNTNAYTARITLNGNMKSFPLPAIKSTGSALRIANSVEGDSLKAAVIVSTNLTTSVAAVYHLVGQSGGKIYYDEEIPVTGNTFLTKGIAKDLFPTGIARFTVMNAQRQPLNERIAFIDHHDNLEIRLKPGQAFYKTRDSISVAIEVKDIEGRPIEGSFSLAVTDDSQVQTDSLSTNIMNTLLLTSGLKGTIEAPGHYLQATPQAAADLDHLLLTQGWIGYDWKEVFNPPAVLSYPAQPDFVVAGKVTNAFNKKSALTSIQLLSLKPEYAKISTTGDDGSFSFGELPFGENLKFFLQAKNKNGKSFNVGIQIDEFKPEEFKPASQRFVPWYVNSDTVLLRQANTRALQEAKLNARGTNLLQEVIITAKKAVKDSKNLNGAGEADQILDEKDIGKAPKKTLLNLMNENIKGFNVGIWPSKNVVAVGIESLGVSGLTPPKLSSGRGSESRDKTAKGTVPMVFSPVKSYRIFDKEIHLVIDGINIESLYQPTPGQPVLTMDPQLVAQRDMNPAGDYILERNTASPDDRQKFIKEFLDGILAEDVKGIEVMSNPQYNNRYKSQYDWKISSSLSMISADFAYVEVTTYSGNGAYLKTPPGVYLHKPMSYVNTAAFYRPKYTVKTSPLSDFRSTIHWEPDIITDKDGKAIVSFYSADRPGTYSIIMEGSDMKGNIGRKTGTLIIK